MWNTEADTKWPQLQTTFSSSCVAWKLLYFIEISLKFVSRSPINNKAALIYKIMASYGQAVVWADDRLPSLRTHMCVTRPWWVNTLKNYMTAIRGYNSVFIWRIYFNVAVTYCNGLPRMTFHAKCITWVVWHLIWWMPLTDFIMLGKLLNDWRKLS